jgi:hypothetical protein
VNLSRFSMALAMVAALWLSLDAAWGNAADLNLIKYKFSPGGTAEYRLKLRYDVKMEGAQKINNSISELFLYRQKVRRVRAGGVSLSLTFPLVKAQLGLNAPGFNSRDPQHMDAAKKQQTAWRIYGAISTSELTMRVKETGEVQFLRIKRLDPEFQDERTGEYVKRSLETIKFYAFLTLSGIKAEPGVIWNTHIPVKFIGGPLSGYFVHIPVALNLDQISGPAGERNALFKVSSFKTPMLKIQSSSGQKVKFDLKIENLSGQLNFSLDHGLIKNYAFVIDTFLKVSVNGKTAALHYMKVAPQLDKQ